MSCINNHEEKNMKRLRTPLSLLVVIICFGTFGNIEAEELHESYPPMQQALHAMISDEDVTVREQTVDEWGEEENFFFAFEPTNVNPTVGFIFYPGAFLDPRSYAPPMHSIAAQGYLTVIVKMPRDLAVLGHTRAHQIIETYTGIERWIIGGHSIGGSFACAYAKEFTDKLDGVVLWASWPSETFRLDGTDLKAISIYGTKDGKPAEIEGGSEHLPADAQFVKIEGGNHTQFGWYDTSPEPTQEGDNPADITREAQQEIIIDATEGFLEQFSTSSCPIELLYGQHSREVTVLKKFRDSVLRKTIIGKQVITLYYELSPSVVKFISNNKYLRIEAQKLFDLFFPWICKAVE